MCVHLFVCVVCVRNVCVCVCIHVYTCTYKQIHTHTRTTNDNNIPYTNQKHRRVSIAAHKEAEERRAR